MKRSCSENEKESAIVQGKTSEKYCKIQQGDCLWEIEISLSRLAITVAYPTGVYLFKVNNENTRTMNQICSKLTIKRPERLY